MSQIKLLLHRRGSVEAVLGERTCSSVHDDTSAFGIGHRMTHFVDHSGYGESTARFMQRAGLLQRCSFPHSEDTPDTPLCSDRLTRGAM